MTKPAQNDLSSLSDDDLFAELARRRSAKLGAAADMTAMEMAAEGLKTNVGEEVMRRVLTERCALEDGKPTRCPKCGGRARVEVKKQDRTLRTLSGQQAYRRNYYRCSGCKHGFAPIDDELGIPADGTVTVEVEKRIADFGVNDVFEDAAKRFSLHYGWSISENLVRRVLTRVSDVLESLPEPAMQKALLLPSSTPAQLLTIGIDGSMLSTREGWQETKLGVVVRDEHHVVGGPQTRGAITEARYVVGHSATELGPRLLAAAEAAGLETAKQVVVVSDGAPWIRGLVEQYIPQATQVLDWPHVVQHLTDCGKAVLGEHDPLLPLWVSTTTTLVWGGNVDRVCNELRLLLEMDDVPKAPVEGLLRYLHGNRDRVDYPKFRLLGLPVGSGVIESGHKHVLQVRMKRAGQHWAPDRCRRMARLRAAQRTAGPHFTTRLRETRRGLFGT